MDSHSRIRVNRSMAMDDARDPATLPVLLHENEDTHLRIRSTVYPFFDALLDVFPANSVNISLTGMESMEPLEPEEVAAHAHFISSDRRTFYRGEDGRITNFSRCIQGAIRELAGRMDVVWANGLIGLIDALG